MSLTIKIKQILEKEFSDIVIETKDMLTRQSIGSGKIRCFIKDGSFVDIFVSQSLRFSCHWERRALDGKIYRVDNAPNHPEISSAPWHFHYGSDSIIKPFKGSTEIGEIIKGFFNLIRSIIKE